MEDLLAVALEAEVPRFDDAGVNGSDRDLVNLLSFDLVIVRDADQGRFARVALIQSTLQPSGLFLVALSLPILIPFGWVYAYYQNVTVLGAVSSGAEVVAGGSIHVYGALRGRALAGSMGNARARIFCRKNEAELISIDGYYQTAEEMDASLRSRPTQCWLQDRVLSIAALD